VFQALKLKKKSKYIIFKVNDKRTEIIPVKDSSSSDYDDFLNDLPESECRWAVYDLEFQNDEGGQRNKIIFFQWYVGSSTKKYLLLACTCTKSVPMALIKVHIFVFVFPIFASPLISFCFLLSLSNVAITTRHGQVTRWSEGQGQDGDRVFARRSATLFNRYRGRNPRHR
jgi:cofilin